MKMNFTIAEQQLIVKNVNSILEFVREEVCPFIREFRIFKFNDDPSNKPIMFEISPGKQGALEFTRGFDSCQYKLGKKYDPCHWSGEQLQKRYNLWDCYDVMYAFIENWPRLKKEIMAIVDHDKNVADTLNNFKV